MCGSHSEASSPGLGAVGQIPLPQRPPCFPGLCLVKSARSGFLPTTPSRWLLPPGTPRDHRGTVDIEAVSASDDLAGPTRSLDVRAGDGRVQEKRCDRRGGGEGLVHRVVRGRRLPTGHEVGNKSGARRRRGGPAIVARWVAPTRRGICWRGPATVAGRAPRYHVRHPGGPE